MRGSLQLDEALAEQQQAAYAVEGVDEAEPATAAAARLRKRKKVYVNGEEVRFVTPSIETTICCKGGRQVRC